MYISRCAVSAAVALALTSPLAAEPAQWAVDPAQSTIAIVYQVDGEPRAGSFAAFEGEAVFDAAAIADAQMTLEIETGSIDAGDPFGTSVVQSIDWLYVEAHPRATYRLMRLERIEGDRYRARGELTLRGATAPVDGELTLVVNEGRAEAIGAVRFDREEFGVGIGFSTLFVEIGPEIAVEFDLVATRLE